MAFLRGFGSYLPSRVVTNDELAAACEVEPDWILSVSGIRERRYAAEDETVATLGTRAAQDCFARCGITAADLGMIVVSSGSPDRYCPGPAAEIAKALGLTTTPALDVPVASAGSLIALAMAAQFAEAVGPVLVIGSEIMSRRVERTPEGKNTAILFGDGAGAALVDPAQGFARILGHALHTDGSAAEILKMEDRHLHMDGGSVILQASRKIPNAVKALLERFSVTPEQVGTAVMHQANLNLIQRVAKVAGIPMERFPVNIDKYGNTSSASMLIAAAEWHASRGASPLSGHLLFITFGAGLNWGALLAEPV
ncbi:MAG TPA: ketoacyl-ACP synthase III [Acidobacteriaceae bacterium]|jgi:3-oxoacyl-[acyl-carrier-protein] synthase-3